MAGREWAITRICCLRGVEQHVDALLIDRRGRARAQDLGACRRRAPKGPPRCRPLGNPSQPRWRPRSARSVGERFALRPHPRTRCSISIYGHFFGACRRRAPGAGSHPGGGGVGKKASGETRRSDRRGSSAFAVGAHRDVAPPKNPSARALGSGPRSGHVPERVVDQLRHSAFLFFKNTSAHADGEAPRGARPMPERRVPLRDLPDATTPGFDRALGVRRRRAPTSRYKQGIPARRRGPSSKWVAVRRRR